MQHRVSSILLLILLAGGGCGRWQQTEAPQQPGPEYYGTLPGLNATADEQLREELARIVAEGGTPELLARPAIAPEDNVAAGLAGLFAREEIPAILERSEEIFERVFPPRRFEPDSLLLQGTAEFRRSYEAQRLRAQEALRRPECDFGVPWMAGLQGEWTFIDEVRVCARLEALQAAEALRGGDLDGAIESLGQMLRLARWLAAERLPVARLEAAFLRTEAFRVLQAVVQDERVTRGQLDRLCETVEAHLAAWPDDAEAWIGDRALGLHTYELVRAGRLGELLSEAEIEQYQKDGVLEGVQVAAVRGVDGDELYYLQTMRKVIDGCRQPYYARVPLFDSIGRELQEMRDARELPIVAAWVLKLPDVRKGHAIQAQDRANWEAWALALALATGRHPPAYRINPLTGQEYRHDRHNGTIELGRFGSGLGGDNPSIVVPDLSGGE